MENQFGDIVSKEGVLIREGEWVVYTSHKGYEDFKKNTIFEKRSIERLANKINEELKKINGKYGKEEK